MDFEAVIEVSNELWVFFSFSFFLTCSGGVLWHVQNFLQYIKLSYFDPPPP
jgi:hypothetical protein